MRMRVCIQVVVASLILVMSAGGAWPQEGLQRDQITAHYKVSLEIGNVVTMLMPDQAAGAKEGEVMVHMPGTRMVTDMTDQGKPVNHHLEVHIYEKSDGARVTKIIPRVAITNQGTGKSRSLTSMAPMYDVKEGEKDLHFGSNLYLPEGKYTVAVTVGNEKAIFKDLVVTRK